MSPTAEPACMHCGAQATNDVAWKLPVVLLVSLVLCFIAALVSVLVR